MTKEEAYKKLEELIKKFEEYYDSYHKQDYNETLTRRDFIDPFFKILNWDIDNEQALAQSYREVIHEDKVKVGKETKAPDYSFRIGGKIVFYVEAKKPSVELKDNIEPAYQVRRYGWSAKLPISLLTDFEEFAIYDCTKKPNQNDKASTARIKYINYKEYLKEFDFLWDLFNKDNIPKGSLEKYTSNLKDKKGTEEVGDEFLASLDNYREKLASNISKLNTDFTSRDINFTVQQIVDRIIFLRIAEDRGVENYGGLRNALNGKNYYQNMFNIFLQADGKYNSGLFDFSKDTTSKKTIIDNKVIKEIVNDLYYPKSPYEFSVLPVEILGSAYEQFLGKTITITDNHKAKIEYKPEVRKAGGVYYTPEYIVDYIVENTVGEMVKNRTPKEIEKIKIVDPACGSGSFLLGAYKYLLSYHKKYYNEKKLKGRGTKEDVLTPTGELTTRVKKQILINNIYGVDIDANAVEVTKLSLLLKCLEGETPESLQNEKSLFNERALPSLEDNIKCGNSLIGNDFYSQGNLELDEETMYKINCFDWEKAFSSVFKNGGFDCVIGNPPYVDSEEMVKSSPLERDYCSDKYTVSKGNWDLYCVFCEKSMSLLNDNGIFGYIIPNKFLSLPYGEHLKLLLSKYRVLKIRDYSSVSVFVSNGKKINVYPIVIVVEKNNGNSGLYQKMITEYDIRYEKEFKIKDTINWTINFDKGFNVINNILNKSKKLSEGFIIENAASVAEAYEIKRYLKDDISTKNNFIFVNTGTIDRYSVLWGYNSTQYIKDKYEYPIIKKDIVKKKFTKRYDLASSEKIIAAGMVKRLEFCYDINSNILAGKSTTIILNKSNIYNLKYILALLNSRLYNKVFLSINKHNAMSGGYVNVNKNSLSEFIYYPLDLTNKDDKAKHDKLVTLVDKMLELNKKIITVNSPHEKEIIKRQIEAFDSEIDKLVYSLYNLTDNEIKVVEGN